MENSKTNDDKNSKIIQTYGGQNNVMYFVAVRCFHCRPITFYKIGVYTNITGLSCVDIQLRKFKKFKMTAKMVSKCV